MNIQDNCSDVPEQSTESNYGLLLSKKYRIKISENYSKFVYKKFFKKIPNKYVLKFDAYSDLEIIEYALTRITSGEVTPRHSAISAVETQVFKVNLRYSLTCDSIFSSNL